MRFCCSVVAMAAVLGLGAANPCDTVLCAADTPICEVQEDGVTAKCVAAPAAFCPIPPSFGTCVELCASDQDCNEGKLCCSNGCGHECTDPTTVDPCAASVCPAGSTCVAQDDGTAKCVYAPTDFCPISPNCEELCASDQDCDEGKLCCSNGCGRSCEDPTTVNPCIAITCPAGSTCVPQNDGTVKCVDPCNPSPCSENAGCSVSNDMATCFCLPGYTGNPLASCEDIDECLTPNICLNGGICTNTAGGFDCMCPEGYTGERCETEIVVNPCDLTRCETGTICKVNSDSGEPECVTDPCLDHVCKSSRKVCVVGRSGRPRCIKKETSPP